MRGYITVLLEPAVPPRAVNTSTEPTEPTEVSQVECGDERSDNSSYSTVDCVRTSKHAVTDLHSNIHRALRYVLFP